MRAPVNRSQRMRSHFLAIFCLLMISSLACNLPFLSQEKTPQDKDSIRAGLVQNVSLESYPVDTQGYLLSEAQRNFISDYGYPDRFRIHFYDLELSSGEEVKIRQENWYYDQAGYEIIFRNGEKFTDRITDPVTAPELQSTAYRPEHFVFGMSLGDVLFVTGENGYYAESMPDELFESGKIVFLKGLSAGFENGKLRYLETITLGNAGV